MEADLLQHADILEENSNFLAKVWSTQSHGDPCMIINLNLDLFSFQDIQFNKFVFVQDISRYNYLKALYKDIQIWVILNNNKNKNIY